MLKKILNLKVFLMSFIFVGLFGFSVFADTIQPTTFPKTTDPYSFIFKQDPKVESVFYYKPDCYYCMSFEKMPTYDPSNHNKINDNGDSHIWEYNGKEWNLVQTNKYYEGSQTGTLGKQIVSSNFTLRSIKGDKVFFSPMTVTKATEIPQLIMGHLQVLIPVGIAILILIGILPYLVKSLRIFV